MKLSIVKNIRLLIFISSLSLFATANAQFTFECTISNQEDQCVTSIIETDEYYLLVTYVDRNRNSVYEQTPNLFKIDKQGNIVLSTMLKPEYHAFVLYEIISNEDGSFTGFGFHRPFEDSLAYFTIIEISDKLSILNEFNYQTCFDMLDYINVEKYDDNYIIVGSGRNPQNYLTRIFAYRINSSYDTLYSKIYPEEGTKFPFDIITSENGNFSKIFVIGYHQQTNTSGQLFLLDPLLERVEIKGIPERIAFYNDAKYIDNGHYLLTGKKHIPNSHPQDEQLAIILMDTTDAMQDIQLLGASDTLDYPGFYTNLDFIGIDNIYYSGTKNIILGGYFVSSTSWFFLNKLDSNLEVQWQKFYGGDAYYMLWAMIATQDGGCLMAGTRYDYLTQTNERDIYIVKVNSDGLVTGIGDEHPLTTHDAIVYPNPGSSYLKIQSGPQINGAAFEMFDMTGKEVAREILNGRLMEINTGPLPTGTYTYRISWQNRLVGSGKWVKK